MFYRLYQVNDYFWYAVYEKWHVTAPTASGYFYFKIKVPVGVAPVLSVSKYNNVGR